MQNSILSVQEGKTRYSFNQLPWHLEQGHGAKPHLIRYKKKKETNRENKTKNTEILNLALVVKSPKVGRVKNSSSLYD